MDGLGVPLFSKTSILSQMVVNDGDPMERSGKKSPEKQIQDI